MIAILNLFMMLVLEDLSNAIPELAKDSNLGVYIELDKIPNSDKSMSPMEIWSNESQERYVMAIHPKNKKDFEEYMY